LLKTKALKKLSFLNLLKTWFFKSFKNFVFKIFFGLYPAFILVLRFKKKKHKNKQNYFFGKG
jgi:hypothetical protein